MNTIDKYILRELIPPFFGGLGLLTTMLLLDKIFDLMDLLVKKGVPLGTVLEVLLLALPFIIAMTVPMSALIASLVAFGRLAQDFEIIALKSLGIGFMRILRMPFVFGVSLFILMTVFDNTILPESNHKFKNLMLDIYEKKPAAKIKKGLFNEIGDFLIYIRDKNDKTGDIEDVMIAETLPDGRVRTIMAKRGKIVKSDGNIILELNDGEIHETFGKQAEHYRRTRFTFHSVTIPLGEEVKRKERKYRSDREMSALMLYKEREKVKNELEKIVGKNPVLLRYKKERLNRLTVELNKKFALPFASIVFSLLGAPVATRTKRGGYGTAFGVAFLVFTLYYTFLTGGEELADRAYLNPYIAVWFANIFFGILSLILILRDK